MLRYFILNYSNYSKTEKRRLGWASFLDSDPCFGSGSDCKIHHFSSFHILRSSFCRILRILDMSIAHFLSHVKLWRKRILGQERRKKTRRQNNKISTYEKNSPLLFPISVSVWRGEKIERESQKQNQKGESEPGS